MSLNKQKFLMATPALTWEYTTGSHRNLRKTMRLPLAEIRFPIPIHCVQSNSVFPIKQVRSLDLLDGTLESPQEYPHNSGRTLMSLKECEIVQCSPNQLEMTPSSHALAPEQSPIPLHTRQVA